MTKKEINKIPIEVIKEMTKYNINYEEIDKIEVHLFVKPNYIIEPIKVNFIACNDFKGEK